MHIFTSNYPLFRSGEVTLLPTPARLGAPAEYSGRGVVMAFIDSGFYLHPDLGQRVLLHVDASTRHIVAENGVSRIDDLSWHGQMTSVIAAGDGHTSGGHFRGAASSAQLVLIKVTNPRGQIKEADILRGLRWLVDHHQRWNIRVVNLSVGGDFVSSNPAHPIYQTVTQLVEAGIVVVAAAGNKGQEKIVPPASAPLALTVGGMNDHNTRDRSQWTAYHNDYGSAYDGSAKPEITAPAMWIASPILPGSLVAREAQWLAPLLHEAVPNGALRRLLHEGYADLGLTREQASKPDEHVYHMLQQRINGHKLIDAHHQHVDGTSVAAAVASSVVAQMLEANPRLTPAQVRTILQQTAYRLPAVPVAKQGAGVIDAAAAIRAAQKAAG
ncbi:MAG: S8 family serine peptidase [Chloroflexi bacterium]|nr:S8 family serine peptidase [Chloroflexota bacterium]